ncbi:MAG: guanosine-3,5-bis(diphosphate) 3-pyrophosphohydrolase, partial [Proteobacteria bacterium]|nr:guanosine-3,5-bis(diphosphate) 3-pyrophosphohydrolase [Pseudomonadota bacterium]
EKKPSRSPLIIKGTEGMVVSLAKCCRPIPGDPIVGFFNPGKGIVVHLNECKNVNELRKKQVNWLDVEWHKQVTGEFPVEVRLELLNKLGTLAKVASTISRMRANIENVQITNQDSEVSTDLITLMVKDRVHLAKLMRELRRLSVVLKISRVKSELRKSRI